MIIQFNADNNLTVHDEFREKLQDHITNKLSRFEEHLTRVELHLSDENGTKKGPDDKKCLMEARFEGRPPIVVNANGGNYEIAVDNALDKLKSSLNKLIEKIQDR